MYSYLDVLRWSKTNVSGVTEYIKTTAPRLKKWSSELGNSSFKESYLELLKLIQEEDLIAQIGENDHKITQLLNGSESQ